MYAVSCAVIKVSIINNDKENLSVRQDSSSVMNFCDRNHCTLHQGDTHRVTDVKLTALGDCLNLPTSKTSGSFAKMRKRI